MAKRDREERQEMSAEEARAARLAAAKPKAAKELSEAQKREAFRLHWVKEKAQYGKAARELEDIIWLHLKAIKMDEPAKFDEGIKHFGLKKE